MKSDSDSFRKYIPYAREANGLYGLSPRRFSERGGKFL